MIFPDWELQLWAERGGVEEFNPDHINPASIDLTIGDEFIDLSTGESFVSPSITIRPGDAILATTREYISMPQTAAGVVYLKSSLAREGLDHALAGFIDPGFRGELTLELHSHRPVELHAGQRIIQLVLYQMTGAPDSGYRGRYQGQRGPTMVRRKSVE